MVAAHDFVNLAPDHKLYAGRYALMKVMPLIGPIALRCRYAEDARPVLASVDTVARVLRYNPKLITEWVSNIEEAMTVVAHECLHIAQRFHLRIPSSFNGITGPKLFRLVNKAADLVINSILMTYSDVFKNRIMYEYAGMTDALVNEVLKLGTTEAVLLAFFNNQCSNDMSSRLNLAMNKEEQNCIFIEENCDHGEIEPLPISDDWAAAVIEGKTKQQACKHRGDSSSQLLDSMLDDLFVSQIPWQSVIAQYIQSEFGFDRYVYHKSSRRQTGDFFSPGIMPPPGAVGVLMDTSGSMDRDQMCAAFSEISAMLAGTDVVLYLGMHTTDVYHAGRVELKDLRELPFASGGTSHVEAFGYLQGEHPKFEPPAHRIQLIVCFTDLETCFPENPNVPVIWVDTSQSKHEAPFGIVHNYHPRRK